MRRGKPLAAVSEKRKAEAQERDRVREQVLRRARWQCEAIDLVPEVACGGHLDVDEIVPRGVRPGGHLDPDNCQALCRRHHDWKHREPAEAERRGLRRWSTDDA